jgi:NAD(P)H-binding
LFLAHAFSRQDPQSSKPATRVLVTGAAGKTGRIVLQKLESDPRYEPKALVRTEKSARSLVQSEVKCPLAHVVIADVTSPTFLDDLPALHHRGLDGLEAMIICTSAVPRISRASLVAMLCKAPWNFIRRRPLVDFRSLQFKWKHGGYPELVDYRGQVAQIELAKLLGIKHVVVISSMGGTDPNNFLNSVGKNKKDGSGHGDILLWKRRAEKYLIEVRDLVLRDVQKKDCGRSRD